MTPKLLLTVCGAALVAIGPAGAQTYPTQPPAERAAPPPSLETPAPAQPRTYQAPERAQPDAPTLPAPDLPQGVGPERTDLGRDCAATPSRVQRTICLNRDLAALDRDVARLAGGLPGGANQGAWVQSLERCAAAASTVYDGPIYRCLNARYKARLVQLSRMAGAGLSGQHRLTGRPGSGEMTVVEWPEGGRATVIFDMITADGARACGSRMDATLARGTIQGSPDGMPACRLSIAIDRGQASVQSNGCAALCEMGQRVDGNYVSFGAIAPAARPSRRAPAPRPATPKRSAPRY